MDIVIVRRMKDAAMTREEGNFVARMVVGAKDRRSSKAQDTQVEIEGKEKGEEATGQQDKEAVGIQENARDRAKGRRVWKEMVVAMSIPPKAIGVFAVVANVGMRIK